MKDKMPSWPQLSVMVFLVSVLMICAYLLCNRRDSIGGAAPALAVISAAAFIGFFVSLYFFYLRPQYGSEARLGLVLFLLGHAVLVLLLWRVGALG